MTGAYQGEQWRQVRRAAMARDNGQCQDCGQTDDLHAHHIKPVREFENEEDAHYLENLVILCKYCHKKWEGTDARPKLAEAEPGVTINEVVAELTLDTLKWECFAAAMPDIYWRYIVGNPGRCSDCFKSIDGEHELIPWGSFVRYLTRVLTCYPTPSNKDRIRNQTSAVLSYCERCATNAGKTQTAHEIRHNLLDRIIPDLEEAGLPISEKRIRQRFVYQTTPEYPDSSGRGVYLQAAISLSISGKFYPPENSYPEVYCPDYEERNFAHSDGQTEESYQKAYLEWYKSGADVSNEGSS